MRLGALVLSATQQRQPHVQVDVLAQRLALGRPSGVAQMQQGIGVIARLDQRFGKGRLERGLRIARTGLFDRRAELVQTLDVVGHSYDIVPNY